MAGSVWHPLHFLILLLVCKNKASGGISRCFFCIFTFYQYILSTKIAMQKTIFLFILLIQVYSVHSQPGTNTEKMKTRINQSRPFIVGHRGGFDTSLAENSMAMFDFTFSNACFKPIAIEFDIRKSASGSLFIMHDSNVGRTTNGQGEIVLLTDSYIKTLLLKDRNGNLTTEKVPLFKDVLLHFKDQDIVLMLDVKGNIYPEVIELVTQLHMESKCIILTFNQENTRLVMETTKDIMISALVQKRADWEYLLKLQIPGQQLIAYVNSETPPELITEINNSNVLLMTDMSESIRNNSKQFDSDYYKSVLSKMHLGIMITDYPLHVNKLFCEE